MCLVDPSEVSYLGISLLEVLMDGVHRDMMKTVKKYQLDLRFQEGGKIPIAIHGNKQCDLPLPF